MNKFNIKVVDIKTLRIPVNGLVGFAVVKYAGLILSSIGIYTLRGCDGYRITYPTKKAGQHDINVYNPYDRELSQAIESAVLDHYIANYTNYNVKTYGSGNFRSTYQ